MENNLIQNIIGLLSTITALIVVIILWKKLPEILEIFKGLGDNKK